MIYTMADDCFHNCSGANWGFADDAEEEEDDEEIDMSKNPYAKTTGKAEHEEKYTDDPRKCLQNWWDERRTAS